MNAQYIIVKLLSLVLKQIDPEDLKKYADAGLDKIEDKYKDNAFVIGLCNLIRAACSVPDNDPVE